MPRGARHSHRSTLALVLGFAAFVVALAALVMASIAVFEIKHVKTTRVMQPESAPVLPNHLLGAEGMATQAEAMATQAEAMATQAEAMATQAEDPSRPWYGLCPRYHVRSVEDFRQLVQRDVQLAVHFGGFRWQQARLVTLDGPLQAHVSYRKNGQIAWTTKKLQLQDGETVIIDGTTMVRSYCCNEISAAPRKPTLPDEPPEEALQPPVIAVPPLPAIEPEPPAAPPTAAYLEYPPVLEPFPTPPVAPPLAPPPILPPGVGPPPLTPIPEPHTWLLIATGLAGIGWYRWKQRRDNRPK